MKMKITAYLLLAAMSVAIFAFSGTAFAAAVTTFDIAQSSTSVGTGTYVTYTVSAKNVSDMDAFEISITFDSDKLEPVTGKIISKVEGGQVVPQVKGGKIILAFAKTAGKTMENGDVSLASFTFNTKKSGSANVTLDTVKLLNSILAETKYTVSKTVPVTITGTSGTSTSGTVTTIDATGDKTGDTVTVNVDPDGFKDAIDKANGGTVVINVTNAGDADEVVVNIPAQLFRSAELNQSTRVQINTGLATVYLSLGVIKENIGTSSANIQFTVSKVDTDTLSEQVRKTIGNNTVYDFNLSIDGKKVSNMNTGGRIAEIELPYTLKPGEKPGKIVVYYIDENGNLQVVKNGRYDAATGTVKFSPRHFSKYAIAYSDVTFSDLAGVSWAKDSIEALAGRGIINGTGNGRFAPGSSVTRAEFLKMLIQAFDLADTNVKCSFSDVKVGAWYYDSVASAQKLGIVNGKGDGAFGINDKITRQDMAVMAYKAALMVDAKLNMTAQVQFSDKTQILSYAADAVTAMQKAGIINGVGNGRFAPRDNSTRAQAATIIYRLLNTL
jgi:hypothetical protein